MTRLLSELLHAPEPSFRLGLRHLEQLNGNPSADVRLSTEILHAGQAKVRELGLDPRDTTSGELYQVLLQRFAADDERLERAIQRLISGKDTDTISAIAHAIEQAPIPKQSYALKAASLKKLLAKNPPKRAMKQLGYRSVDSLLKHESPACVLTAALLTETQAWQKKQLDSYSKLKPSDFETRAIAIHTPNSKRWVELSEAVVAAKRHNLISLKEAGAVILLPLPSGTKPRALTTTTLVLTLHALNEIRAASTYLKLAQVRRDFGQVVQQVAADELHLKACLLDQPVPWQLIQRYYDRFKHLFREEIFEPHIQLDDLSWHGIEQVLSHFEPRLSFWHDTAHLSWLHEHQTVSFNIVDVALNYCNQLSFQHRVTHHAQTSLWHELMLGYLKHDTVEQTVLAELQPELAAEVATN